MEHMKFETPDMVEKNIEKIKALFPSVMTEGKDENGNIKEVINFEALKQLLSKNVIDGDECYEFTWVGKKAAMAEAAKPTTKTLRPVKDDSKDWDTTENLYIEGDNLEVLKILQESYLGKIKMIYIDPPYNTGHDFVYPDSFVMDDEEYNGGIGYFDEKGNVNFARENSDSAGKYHSDWCSMIYSRLKLARNLLNDAGLILISIDDCEQDSLKKICNEVFGAQNFIDTLIWKKRYGGGAKEKYFVSLHEYVLVYCKDIGQLSEIFVPLTKESAERYYSKKDSKYEIRGGYRTHPLEAGKAMDERPNLVFPIPAPDGSLIMPKRQWLWSKERVMNALSNDELEITQGKDGWVVSSKQYLRDDEGNIRPAKMLSIIDDIYTQHGTNEMINIMGNAKIFSYPKPSELIKRLVSAATETKDEYILDFFSGSSATAHAVMQLNSEDGGSRKFIMVQLPEPCDEKSDAAKAGYKNICEIGKERIRRAGDKIKAENPMGTKDLDTGFRVFRLDESNMKDVYYHPEELDQMSLTDMVSNIKEDRTDMDLLYSCLLDWGVEINFPHTTTILDGCTIHNVDNGALMACFNEKVPASVIQYMAKQQPLRAVFRDSGFAADDAKINVEETFKNFSPDTSVRVL